MADKKNTVIIAVDPGPKESGWALYDGCAVIDSGIESNEEMRSSILRFRECNVQGSMRLAIEMIASYGMAVGAEVFETCVWIGRMVECWGDNDYELIYRKDVKMHLCGTPRAKDANIRQALIDKLGPQGTKKAPGPTYGVKSHAWAALAVAVYASDKLRGIL